MYVDGDFFFFSSRRRHTRYWRDWSSDVCSSDLAAVGSRRLAEAGRGARLGHARGVRGGLRLLAAGGRAALGAVEQCAQRSTGDPPEGALGPLPVQDRDLQLLGGQQRGAA